MLVRRAVSVLLALSLALAGPTQGSQDAIVVAPTDEQALATDAKPLADKMGWELTRAMDYLKEQELFGTFSDDLHSRYPHTFAGAWRHQEPQAASFVRFVGAVPSEAVRTASMNGLEVTFIGESSYSVMELQRRADALHEDLLVLGAESVATTYSVESNRVEASASKPPHLAALTSAELLSLLPIRSQDSDIDIRFHQEAVAGDFATYGGTSVIRNDGTYETWCTGGFVVRHLSSGARGLATAGHCSGLWRYEQPNGNTPIRWPLQYVTAHIGDWGDMEWHTVDGTEYPEFYPWTGASRRTVTAVDQSIAAGDWLCGMGRVTGYQKCDYVYKTSVTHTPPGGATSRRLVAMTSLQFQNHDSGGPWYLGNTAQGMIKGWSSIDGGARDLWTRAMYLEEGLGVTVLLGS